jgi:hypothetical protein
MAAYVGREHHGLLWHVWSLEFGVFSVLNSYVLFLHLFPRYLAISGDEWDLKSQAQLRRVACGFNSRHKARYSIDAINMPVTDLSKMLSFATTMGNNSWHQLILYFTIIIKR